MLERGSEWRRWDLHLHTASSYDYQYKGKDADELLCKTLHNNDIKAAAITDHFTIDKHRIESLRNIAPDIVFFPGVELRIDKGANNLHIILIFSEKMNLEQLSGDFDAIMLRNKAKSKESDEKIYWTFEDVVEFAKGHDALITIHAGHKTNGIDKEITNALPVKEAIKKDIASAIHFFEVGQIRDIRDYEEYVFRDIERKPIIMCSDCHDPRNYTPKESLWIKADLTFNGLKQCLYQPQERVYIGTTPPMLDRLQKNRQGNIDRIEIKRIDAPANKEVNWFDIDIPLNAGMVAIIGNKGSGKSALSDVIGHLCKTRFMKNASFLTEKRFRKAPKDYAKDYIATIHWVDGEKASLLLDESEYETTIEDAQYLPQQFIEAVCNDIEDTFQQEIDKVIFSYVSRSERGDALNLSELMQQKAKAIETRVSSLIVKLKEINSIIIRLEDKKTKAYKTQMLDSKKKLQESLARHDKSKPQEIQRPEPKAEDKEYQEKLKSINNLIDEKKRNIDIISNQILKNNTIHDEILGLISKIELLEASFHEVEELINTFARKNKIKERYTFALQTPKEYFTEYAKKIREEKQKLQEQLNNPETGEISMLNSLEEQKASLIATADYDEKIYQKYLADLNEWQIVRNKIIGNKETDGTLEYYKNELLFLESTLDDFYRQKEEERWDIVREIYQEKKNMVSIYTDIYTPVQGEISMLLGDLEDNITFQAETFMQNQNLAQDVFDLINQRFKGKFGRSSDSHHEFDRLLHRTDFSDIDSVIAFINSIYEVATEDIDNAGKKILNRQVFYDLIFGLEYIGVNFKLKMGNRSLNELSPGERGLVLLIFYLALSQDRKPIIIDQPEDNLDNQSVYSKLVPCICKAKQHRQVIIVTHNPNIAVACDAEQVIYCEMNKDLFQITYESGAIENPVIKKHVVDVLEGTMPAFDLRRHKYNQTEDE